MYNEQEIRRKLVETLGPGYPQTMRPNGAAIRRRREQCGLTQGRLGEMVGIEQTRVSRIEGGTVDSIYTEYLYVWMKAFGCERITELGSFKSCPSPHPSAAVPLPSASPAGRPEEHGSQAAEITREQIERLRPRLLEVDQIVTLIQPGSKTSLRDIYYRTLLLEESIFRPSSAPRVRFPVDVLSDLKPSACVILGTAGQGKSILLRWLTIQEALQANTLSLFFELRKWGSDPLKIAILKQLRDWKLAESPQELEELLEQGRISLLLDAFDELAMERRPDFLKELADLHAEFPQLKIVVSARPDSGIQSESWLHPYSIQPLDFTDIESLIRIYAAREDADLIIARIRDADIQVKDLLRSPIFVVLLVIRFEYLRQVPHSIVAFYADLFDALARRHNQDAAGLKREISSGLEIRQLEQAFQLICFHLHKRFGDQSVHIRTVEDTAEEFSKRHSLPEDAPARIVDDIIRITNLMLDEAGMCDFIHRTVKDHHAAAYVAENATDDQAETFYVHLLNHWRRWSGVLWFLEHLDRVRYLRFFAIPELRRFAPYGASEMAKSFRRVKITTDADERFHCRFLLSETECYVLTRQKQFSLFAACAAGDLVALFGEEETQRIRDELRQVREVMVDWQECQQRSDPLAFENSPIVQRLWNPKSAQELHDRIQAWEREVQASGAPDADFEID